MINLFVGVAVFLIGSFIIKYADKFGKSGEIKGSGFTEYDFGILDSAITWNSKAAKINDFINEVFRSDAFLKKLFFKDVLSFTVGYLVFIFYVTVLRLLPFQIYMFVSYTSIYYAMLLISIIFLRNKNKFRDKLQEIFSNSDDEDISQLHNSITREILKHYTRYRTSKSYALSMPLYMISGIVITLQPIWKFGGIEFFLTETVTPISHILIFSLNVLVLIILPLIVAAYLLLYQKRKEPDIDLLMFAFILTSVNEGLKARFYLKGGNEPAKIDGEIMLFGNDWVEVKEKDTNYVYHVKMSDVGTYSILYE